MYAPLLDVLIFHNNCISLYFYAVDIHGPWLKPIFHLANLFARTHKKVGTLPTCSRRIFSPANFNQSRCQILVFASRRANKVAKWKIGLNPYHKILEIHSILPSISILWIFNFFLNDPLKFYRFSQENRVNLIYFSSLIQCYCVHILVLV